MGFNVKFPEYVYLDGRIALWSDVLFLLILLDRPGTRLLKLVGNSVVLEHFFEIQRDRGILRYQYHPGLQPLAGPEVFLTDKGREIVIQTRDERRSRIEGHLEKNEASG